VLAYIRISLAAWGATVLGAVVLSSVFSGPFLFISAFLCAAVTGVGILLQVRRAPRFVIPIVQLAVLVELISFFFLRDTLKFGLLPWRETALDFNQQMVDAIASMNRFGPPLPPDSHLTLFAASVIAAAGLLIHLVAVQLKRAAWAGVPLLTMYLVPSVAVQGGLPALLFIPSAIGYIVLLSAEGRTRLSGWGRRISGISHRDAAEPIDASGLSQTGRRIGLSVVALAALLPAVFPALSEGVVGNGQAASGTGIGIGSALSAGDPMLDMGKNLRRGDNVTALTYTGNPTYLRLTSLDLFDGNIWRLSPRQQGRKITDEPLSPPPGFSGDLGKVPRSKMKIEVTRGFRTQFAPAPYPLRTISQKNWRYDAVSLDVDSSSGQVVGGQKYDLSYYDIAPTPEQLRDSPAAGGPDPYTSKVPGNTDKAIKDLANKVTAGSGSNHFRQAVMLQNWFRSDEFVYSLDTRRPIGMDALKEFLTESKTGYCEQFATSMALMSRILGIPARVGIGFLPGQPGKDNENIVRMHDMHAWPELYFEGAGWVRFEPTPPARVATTPNWTNPVAPGTPTLAPSTSPTTPDGAERPDISKPNDPRRLPGDNGLAPINSGNWLINGGGKAIGITVGAILLLCIPWLIRTLTRRRRFSRPPGRIGIEGLWAEIRDTSRDLGLDWSDTATPRQLGDWLVSEVSAEAHPQALRLARAVESVRYAGRDASAVDVRSEAGKVRRALWSQVKLTRRWRARLLPQSLRWYLNRGSAEAADLLDEFDLLLANLRSVLLPNRSIH
jgi:transglutaminase-like putative cysteine protease